ncbi:MAG: glyoxalase [Streptosporangiales bacterium]|nr:glyoxalase [Streptosporangiales bacterium]
MSIRFHFIGLSTADMARSLGFYRALGFAIPADADDQPHAEFQLPDGGPLMAWDTHETAKSIDPDWTPPAGTARASLAFECEDVAQVDKTYARLVDAGYEGALEPFDGFWGQRYAVVLDPDGNNVDLFAPLPPTG